MRRLTGNAGVAALGVAKERKDKPRRTRPANFVLGPVVSAILDDLARANGITRSEVVRTLIVRAEGKTLVRLLEPEKT